MSEAPVGRARSRWTTFVCGLASYVDGSVIVTWSIVLVIFQQALGLTPTEVGLLSGLLVFGTATGALLGGRLGDRFGRRPVFVVTVATLTLAAVAMIFTTAFPVMVAITVVIGLAAGADLPVSLSTISEATTEKTRARALAVTNMMWLAGTIVPGFLSAAFADLGRTGAQIMLAHVAVAGLVTFLLRFTIPESESWKAARAEQASGIDTVRADRSSVRDLLSAPYAIPFFGLLAYYALIGVMGNVYGQFSTYLLVNVAGADVGTASLLGLNLLPVGIITAVLFYLLVGTRARFTLFRIGVVAGIVGPLIPVVFGFSVTTFLVSIVASSALGFMGGDGIVKFWSQRSFPTLLRTTAYGTIVAVCRYVGGVVALFVPLLIAASPTALFLFIVACTSAGGVIGWVVFRKRDSHSEFEIEAKLEQELAAEDRVAVATPTA